MPKRKAKPWNLQTRITQQIRRVFLYSPMRKEARKNALVKKDHYKCAECKKVTRRKDTHVDHIDPVVDPLTGFVDWNTYVERMFVDASKLAVLCKVCHSIKTKAEGKVRTRVRAERKAGQTTAKGRVKRKPNTKADGKSKPTRGKTTKSNRRTK